MLCCLVHLQGMHEVLAPIYFILHQDALDLSDGSSPVMSLWDKQFLVCSCLPGLCFVPLTLPVFCTIDYVCVDYVCVLYR